MYRVALNIYRWMFARPFFHNFHLNMFHLSLRGLGILNYENDKVSGERYFINQLLPSLINKDIPILFDVGANVGLYSLSLLKQFPNSKIYAFEPHPKNYATLKKNIPCKNFNSYMVALGDLNGKFTLYDRADHNGSSHASLHEAVIAEIHKQETVELSIPVETLDDVCARENINYIDLLKIDTEGSELAVLKGAKMILKRKRIQCIHFEFNEMNIISRVFLRDFKNLLLGYDLYRLLPNGVVKLDDSPITTELFAYQNIIAILRKSESGE